MDVFENRIVITDPGDIIITREVYDKLRAENEELKQNTEFMDNIGWDRTER